MRSKSPILLVTAFTVAFGLVTAVQPLLGASKEKVLYSFKGNTPPRNDGGNPAGSLVFGADGNLYGTTVSGGAYGYGTVFELTQSKWQMEQDIVA
jgi:uncharacterized repeat protein (TIGR03803 family)